MPHEAISNYLKTIEATVGETEDAYTELYEEEILAYDRVNLRIRLRFYVKGHVNSPPSGAS